MKKIFWKFLFLFIFLFLLQNENIVFLTQPFITSFNCLQNIIQKFPPFVLSLPTSADDVKIVKISCPNFDLFKNFSTYRTQVF